jgi:hypothetical protein
MDRQSGAVAVEYAILVGLIAVVIVGAVGALGMAVLPDEQVARIVGVLGGDDAPGGTGNEEPVELSGPDGGGATPDPTSTPVQCEKAPVHAKPPGC